MTAQETAPVREDVEVRRIRRRKPRGRTRAILASMGVLGIGAAVTLAAWTDTEWIFGGTDNGPGIGTSTFNIQQNVNDAAGWRDGPTQGDAGKLNFPVQATALSPGAVVYAGVSLRAGAGSIAGTAVLNGAIAASGSSNTLFTTLTYQAKTGVTQANCTAAGFAGNGTALVPAGTALSTGSGATTIALPAGATSAVAGAQVDICFAITMPGTATAPTYQGLAATPVWNFLATSTS
jgi:predicted ribosomally synthesized peptide with SipW-like signal peptide